MESKVLPASGVFGGRERIECRTCTIVLGRVTGRVLISRIFSSDSFERLLL